MNVTADGSGTIEFDNSVWPSAAFTVQESEEQGSGSASGTAARMNQTPIPFANVSLYYQNGAAYGQTVKSGADVNAGTLTMQCYDLNGDGEVNILDLVSIGQHFGEINNQPYPVDPVNSYLLFWNAGFDDDRPGVMRSAEEL